MTFTNLPKDGGSSSFGMIGNVGRSSRKPGSVVWTLFSWFQRYSANPARINSLFLIRMPSILPSGCREDAGCSEKRLGP